MKRYSFLISTIVFILVIVLCISSTVKGQNSKKLNIRNDYYNKIEDQYVDNIKSKLNDMGFEYAGVTLTKTFNNEICTYTLQIHHKKLDKMSAEERNLVINKLNTIKISSKNFFVKTKILEYNC